MSRAAMWTAAVTQDATDSVALGLHTRGLLSLVVCKKGGEEAASGFFKTETPVHWLSGLFFSLKPSLTCDMDVTHVTHTKKSPKTDTVVNFLLLPK